METQTITGTKHPKLPRSAGILMHPTSLFTPYGIGDLGPTAFKFINFLKVSGQEFWQILPLGPTGYADSPYQTISAFAGNPLLISPDQLVADGLLTKEQLSKSITDPQNPENSWTTGTKVEFERVRKLKDKLFELVYENFVAGKATEFSVLNKTFQKFSKEQAYWLQDFVLFYSLRKDHDYQSWITWPERYAQHTANALKVWEASHKSDMDKCKFIQFLFQQQWDRLRTYAHENGVQIIGDMPIFVAHDSADVWGNPAFFTVDKKGALEFQAGVPPDYFSATGQLWGNPLYNWDLLQKENFKWFISRLKHLFEFVDWARIDHFRGFQAYWKIPGDEKTAINGKWVEAPGKELFIEVQQQLGAVNIIAEDLGIITPEVEELRDYFGFPGMRVLQFAFGGDSENPHLPHNYVRHCIAYTGTHDNNTTLGWWLGGPKNSTEEERTFLKDYLNTDAVSVVVDMIKALYRSTADLVIVPIQDVLMQGAEARMNTPSVPEGNWQYQVNLGAFSDAKAKWLQKLTKMYGRMVKAPKI